MQIKKLTLATSRLEEQLDFYTNVLSFELIESNENFFSIKIGKGLLIFQAVEQSDPYHFAFGIPSNQELDALVWLKERVDIIPYEGNEIQDFDFWNAKSIYFYDTDKNIVELIARRDLKMVNDKKFTSDSIKSIAEIGLANENLETTFRQLKEKIGLELYSGDTQRFAAIGTQTGLFICIDPLEKDWFPNNDKASINNFVTEIECRKKTYKLEYIDGQFLFMQP